jgi:hypothetical protein
MFGPLTDALSSGMIQTLKMQRVVGYALNQKYFSVMESERLSVAGRKVSKEEVITLKNGVSVCFWNKLC